MISIFLLSVLDSTVFENSYDCGKETKLQQWYYWVTIGIVTVSLVSAVKNFSGKEIGMQSGRVPSTKAEILGYQASNLSFFKTIK